MVFLSSCDDELKLVSRDFSVTLKSIDVGTAVVGKPVNCTLTISDLDPDNGDQILTRFEVRDGDGVILVDNNEYSPGETFEYDFKANNRLDFGNIYPAASLYEPGRRFHPVKFRIKLQIKFRFLRYQHKIRHVPEAARTGGDRVYRFKPLRSASERECNDTSKSMKI